MNCCKLGIPSFYVLTETQRVYIDIHIYIHTYTYPKLENNKYPLISPLCISELREAKLASWGARAEVIRGQSRAECGGPGFEFQPHPEAAVCPPPSCFPSLLAWFFSEQGRKRQIRVYHTLISVDGRILESFKYFSLSKRQPS